MVRAVVDIETHRVDLTSLPGGYIIVKRLSFGGILRRQDLAMNMTPGEGESNIDLKMNNLAVTLFEFKNCIIEHNLTDANDAPLRLDTPEGINQLDPIIGQEIDKVIGNINGTDSEDSKSLTKLPTRSTQNDILPSKPGVEA